MRATLSDVDTLFYRVILLSTCNGLLALLANITQLMKACNDELETYVYILLCLAHTSVLNSH